MSDGDLSQFRAGIASRAALLAAGFSQFRIRSALLSGRWQAALPGVVVLHNGPVSANQLRCCALLYAGPASFLSHNTAAYVQGLRVRPTDLVHLTIPHTQHPRSHGFVVVHQSQRPCRLERNGDLRWSEPTRTVLDVAGTLLTRDDVRALVSDAVQRRLVSVAQLEAAVGDVPRRGSRWLRESLEDVGVGTRSMGESRFRRAVRRAGLPEPEWNVPIETAYGKVVLDALWRAASVAVEIDGARWHLDAAAWEADQRRQNAIQASGVLVLRFSVHRLIHDVDGVLDEIRAVLARAIAS
jgi:very-short-patch-repair endonuclease